MHDENDEIDDSKISHRNSSTAKDVSQRSDFAIEVGFGAIESTNFSHVFAPASPATNRINDAIRRERGGRTREEAYVARARGEGQVVGRVRKSNLIFPFVFHRRHVRA